MSPWTSSQQQRSLRRSRHSLRMPSLISSRLVCSSYSWLSRERSPSMSSSIWSWRSWCISISALMRILRCSTSDLRLLARGTALRLSTFLWRRVRLPWRVARLRQRDSRALLTETGSASLPSGSIVGGKNWKALKNQVEVGKSGTIFPEIDVGEESRRSVDRLIGGIWLWRGFNRVANGVTPERL